MLGQVILVGDQHGGDGRVVLVGQARVFVHMGQVLLGEAFHRLLDTVVHVGVTLQVDATILLGQLLEVFDIVVGGKRTLHMHVQPDVDAFVLE
ncbi:hypothetical protein D3C75_1031700 [compost metagenome]